MSILEELYYGNLCPSERAAKKENACHGLMERLAESEARLMERLGREEQALYEDILDIQSKMADISEREMFAEGFRLGAKMMLEILAESEPSADAEGNH